MASKSVDLAARLQGRIYGKHGDSEGGGGAKGGADKRLCVSPKKKKKKRAPGDTRLNPIEKFEPLVRGTRRQFGQKVVPPIPTDVVEAQVQVGAAQSKPQPANLPPPWHLKSRASGILSPAVEMKEIAGLLKLQHSAKVTMEDVDGDFGDVLEQARGMSQLELAIFIRRLPEGIFFYMMPSAESSSVDDHAYNLKAVSHAEIDPLDFHTMSNKGVEHIEDKFSEFTLLDRWEDEIRAFKKLRRMKTFRMFRLWKGYAVWRSTVVTRKRATMSGLVEAGLFVVDPYLQPALLNVRHLCIDIVEQQLCQIDEGKTYTLDEFMDAQQNQINAVKGRLGAFRSEVSDIVMDACCKFLTAQEFETLDVDEAESMTFTRQAQKRKACLKLRNFIRLVDLLVAGSMQSLATESIAYLKRHVSMLQAEAVPSGADFERWDAEQKELEAAHTLSAEETLRRKTLALEELQAIKAKEEASRAYLAISKPPNFVTLENGNKVKTRTPEKKKKTFEARQAKKKGGALPPVKPALISITLTMTKDSLVLEPQPEAVVVGFEDLFDQFKKSVVGLECLLLDDAMQPFTNPVIAGRPSNLTNGGGVNLQAVFDDDKGLVELEQCITSMCYSSFSAVKKFAEGLDAFREMYKSNEDLDEEWVKTNVHEPEFFEESLARYKRIFSLGSAISKKVVIAVFELDCAPFKEILLPSPQRCLTIIENALPLLAARENQALIQRVDVVSTGLGSDPETTEDYVANLEFLKGVTNEVKTLENHTHRVTAFYALVEKYELTHLCAPEDQAEHSTVRQAMMRVADIAKERVDEMPNVVNRFTDVLDKDISALDSSCLQVRNRSQAPIVFDPEGDPHKAFEYTTDLFNEMEELQAKAATFKKYQKQFKIDVTKFTSLEETHAEVRGKNKMWDNVMKWEVLTAGWAAQPFAEINAAEMTNQVTATFKAVYSLSKVIPPNEVLPALQSRVEAMKFKCPLISDLRNPNLKLRHWERINEVLNSTIEPTYSDGPDGPTLESLTVPRTTLDPDHPSIATETPLPNEDGLTSEIFTLGFLEVLEAFGKVEELQEISGGASSESALEGMMTALEQEWNGNGKPSDHKDHKPPMEFECVPYRGQNDVFILGGKLEEIQMLLDDSQVNISTIAGSRHCEPIRERVDSMAAQLSLFSKTLEEWLDCQRSWQYLESIFSAPDIVRQLPEEAKLFQQVDKSFCGAMRKTNNFPNALRAGCTPGFYDSFKANNESLNKINKCLEDYLEGKRAVFSRFYFLSNDELLEILSQTRNFLAVQPHVRKCFDAIKSLEFGDGGLDEEGEKKYTNDIVAMNCPWGEQVRYGKGLKARGNVEIWLGDVEKAMVKSLKMGAQASIIDYQVKERTEWAQGHPSQIVLMVSQIYWTQDVTTCLEDTDSISRLGEYETKLRGQLAMSATLARGKLKKLVRKVLSAMITMDVHARDIVTLMIAQKCDSATKFEWSKQLRYSWDEELDTCVVRMSNAVCYYSYEYLGADMRLVVTPLTDKCYLCLLGAVQLDLGGAPAGPAGTGKTESVKDLAKALGIQCVVFNCSEQMDFRMTGRFFAGLAQSGAWCCFDEFNRIDIEVLSVIAQQILTIRNAKVARQDRFFFEGREIGLVRTCACFITMNPGYAGRTELPDNLKALFRPMSMMVPDYAMIAEVILFSEGFEDPTNLARKMVQMYKLCSEQLSQQDHYDFGMRAVKSVLVMAGSLKRSRLGQTEAQVLLTALRDSNLPKFLTDDAILFSAILGDLFPGVILDAYDYGSLQEAIEFCTEEKGLILTPAQTSKIIQFYETMVVRHGVMLVGPTGGGKTTCYEVLKDALTKLSADGDPDPYYKPVNTYVLNPKAVSMGELYGEVSFTTGEWTDGLMATIVRTCVSEGNKVEDHQWIMCDGPVDALWIENMNTVLDDNKMLCLANSERIKLTPWMHMCFEVQDLAVASPATVSRCGMVYVDPQDMHWQPYFHRWLGNLGRLDDECKEYLEGLFTTYITDILYNVRKNFTVAMEQVDLGKVATMCTLLEQLIGVETSKLDVTVTEDNVDDIHAGIAMCFVFAIAWGIGGNLNQQFHEAFDTYTRDTLSELRGLRIPGLGQLFDFYLNFEHSPPTFEKWEDIVPVFHYSKEMEFFDMLVPTVSTIKHSFLLETFTAANKSTLFTGLTGVGKSVVARDCLENLEKKSGIVPVTMNFSAQTSALRTQEIIESKLQKKGKSRLGAPVGKKIVIFVDDLNMPKLDTYGSQPPIELLRQYQDFKGFYDREKLFWKDITDVVLVGACAPPGGGRNPVTARFIRHFAMFALPKPDDLALKTIFTQILKGFLIEEEFSKPLQNMSKNIIDAAAEIYGRMADELLPTPDKSHYIFNLRDLSKVVQGILQADEQVVREPDQMFDLFCHESLRVFHDRLINNEDKEYYCGMLAEMAGKHFRKTGITAEDFTAKPIIFGDFMKVGAAAEDRQYERLDNDKIGAVLNEYLDSYNMDSTKEMNLVFFNDAIEHVSRIARMIRQPRGNALLVGVGGTGKQSLTRMAAVMGGFKCIQIEINRGYGHTEFREDLKELYLHAGTKGEEVIFLFTDTQIVVESFLEDINNILNSGEVPNLFEPEEVETYIGPCRPLAKAAGLPETRDAVFGFFINRVRQNLHLVLCMSPVGSAFRARCRMFPSLVNCCTIDWFTEWPQEALQSVSTRFFEFVDLGSDEMKSKISEMCVNVHTSVAAMAEKFYDELRRRYYTTPTSYLELINLYISMLDKKRQELVLQRSRYATGVKKLTETDTLIGEMEIELTALTPILKEKTEATALLMINVKKEEADTQKIQDVVAKEEAGAMKEAEETIAIKADAQKDLDLALPALAGAQKALEALDKKDIQEIKAFTTPPEMVQVTLEAVCTLFPKKTGNKTDWKAAKSLLGESDLMKWLFNYDKDNVSDKTLKKVKKFIDDERFQPETVAKTSSACKSLCLWVRAIDLYSHVFRTVEPKREKLHAAEASLKKTKEALALKQATLKEYTDKIALLQKQFKESVEAKETLELQAQLTKDRLKRAGQLQDSLGSEKIRWGASVEMYDKQLVDVIGNVFLGSACVAYFGAFTSSYRAELVAAWSTKCDELAIPRSEGMGLADVLSNPYQIRGWNSNALPNDTLSIENAVLVTQGRRWPLMIDPQDQANTWVRTMERKNKLKVIKLTDGDFLRTLENCIRTGTPCLLEEVQEVLDPSLEPILLKQTFSQGGRLLIRLGDSDVDYDKNFRFYMTSKLNNPHYLPEICIKVTIINFTVTKTGLEDQLLGDVVKLERPDLEEKRTKLIMQINEDKEQLKSIEDKILKLLFNSEGNILDDEELIVTLGESKVTSTAIGERLIEAEQTELGITEARNKYKPVAIRGAIIFFVIADIGLIDDMYQYSLGYFKNLFVLCINQSEKSKDLDIRLQTIMDYSTTQIFTNIARGLFEKHKLVFSFMLCAEIVRSRGDVDPRVWNFYLRGAGAGDKTRPEKPPRAGWLKELTWNNCYDLEMGLLATFEGLTADLVARPFYVQIGNLKVFVNQEDPWEGCADACLIDWNETLSDFEKLLLIKTVKPFKVIDGTIEFVSVCIGPTFVESVAIELEVVYKDLSPTVPMIFVLSTGSDPMTSFMRFAKTMQFENKYDAISLGQGQGPVAERMIAKACKEGRWVFLQNCHLAKSWMNGMEVVIKGLALPDAKVHDDFRLYLSSMPCTFFPIGVLQNSVKVTNEPPKGLRANIRSSFAGVDPEAFASNPLGVAYRKLIFGLCFFHANVQERKKYGPLGWNISYGFSTTDLETTLANLALFLEEQGQVPWDALTFLIGEVYYGGRVTDAWDERTLRVILSRFFVEESLEDGFTYSESGIYYPASHDSAAEYVAYVETFPLSDAPDIFGLHENANIAFLSSEAANLIGNVLSVQPRLTTSGGEKSPDEIVFEVANMVQEKLRKTLIDIDDAKEHTFDRDEKGQVKSLSTVLKQEVDRFNVLLVTLWTSLKNLKNAIKGLVVMSEELEEIYTGFINNQVPKMWSSSSYPSLQPLGAWVTDLVLRLAFIQSWLVDGQPASFWMSGFYYTQGFLTGSLQEHARQYGIPIDTLTFKFEVQAGIYIDPGQTVEESGVTLPKIKDGVLTHGIFMEAFRWDDATHMLADSHVGEMVSYLPVVHMLPSPNFVIPAEDYNAPMYKTNFRQGMLSTTGHSTNFVVPIHFPTDKTPAYWVNKGAALLCQNVL